MKTLKDQLQNPNTQSEALHELHWLADQHAIPKQDLLELMPILVQVAQKNAMHPEDDAILLIEKLLYGNGQDPLSQAEFYQLVQHLTVTNNPLFQSIISNLETINYLKPLIETYKTALKR